MTEIVQHLHGVHIDIQAGGAEECHKLRIPPAALMPRHVKRNQARALHTLKSLLDGRVFL